jgi:hypothetical protein
MLEEERNHVGVEFLVERCPVEAVCVDTNGGRYLGEVRRTRSKKVEVLGIGRDVKIGLRQPAMSLTFSGATKSPPRPDPQICRGDWLYLHGCRRTLFRVLRHRMRSSVRPAVEASAAVDLSYAVLSW